MAVLTKKKTIEEHRKMWNWIADQLEKPHNSKTVEQLKIQYCDIHEVAPRHECFCCAYAAQFIQNNRYENCVFCPVCWDSDMKKYMCENRSGEFDEQGMWLRAQDLSKYKEYQEAAIIARQIAELLERPDMPGDILE